MNTNVANLTNTSKDSRTQIFIVELKDPFWSFYVYLKTKSLDKNIDFPQNLDKNNQYN